MIQKAKINGVNIELLIANPAADDIYAAHRTGATVKELAIAEKATAAVNANFADNGPGVPIGRLIIGGKTIIGDSFKTAMREELYMLPDGTLHIGKAPAGVLWALQGSPRIRSGGKNVIALSINRDVLDSSVWAGKAYRVAYGLNKARQLVIVKTLDKVELDDLDHIFAALGCDDAINFDGGGSAYLWPANSGWGRKMGAALIIKEGQKKMKLIGDQNPDLVIDPGHGGTDPGASGNGIVEKQMTLDISLYQYKRFRELGVKVALTRDSDITLDSTPRATLVKNSGAKHCISNHINAADATAAAGVETIHSIHSDGKLAVALANSITAAGQPFRRVFDRRDSSGRDYYYMHRLTGNVSTVIVEYGFCSNAADAARLKANWQAYAEAAVKAYCDFVGRKYTAPKAPEPPEPPVDGVRIVLDGVELKQRGKLDGNVTMLPARAVAEALGLKVRWDQATKSVHLDKEVK